MAALRLPRSEPSGREETVSFRRSAVERVIDGISRQLDDPASLQRMADLAHLSPFHFDRVFREITGVPPKAFLSGLRLNAAKRRLAETSSSVTDVCFDLGYSSLGSFVARFTKVVGLSPTRWRRAIRAQGTEAVTPGEPNAVTTRDQAAVVVHIEAPPGFAGPIFTGLFAKPCPVGRPVACAVTRAAGAITVRGVPDGLFYLCVAGVTNPLLLADTDRMLRGGGARNPILVRNGIVTGPTTVRLRPKEATDPPILVALPFIGRRLATRLDAHAEEVGAMPPADQPQTRRTPC